MNLQKHWAAVLDDYVIDLAWSPDGAILAAASAAGNVTLFDAVTGSVRHGFAGHENGTNCLAWMPSGPTTPSDLLATGGQDGLVRLWSALRGEQVAEVKLGAAWVEHLAWVGRVIPKTPSVGAADDRRIGDNPPLLFAAAGKKLVALRADGSVAHSFPDAPKTISALAIAPIGRGIPGKFRSPPGSAAPASRSKEDSPFLAAACFGRICVWDALTFEVQKEFIYGNTVLALVWSPDGRWLVAGCQDNAVHLWAPSEDVELHMSGYETKLQELSFSPDSKWLATGGGRDACVWDCAGAGPTDREPLLLPHKARVCAVAFQSGHNVVASASTDGEFCLWAPTHRKPLLAEVKMPSAATKFAWNTDGSLLAAGTEKGSVFVFKI